MLCQRRKLPSLNSRHFDLIGGDGKDWSAPRSAQFGDIFSLTIQDSPAYAGRHGRFCHLNHFGAHRLDDDGVGTRPRALDNLDQLLGLVDGVIVGVNNFDVGAELRSRVSG